MQKRFFLKSNNKKKKTNNLWSIGYYYGSQIFPSQIRNEEPSSRSISPEHTSSIAEASVATQKKKKQYENIEKGK